MNWHYVFLFTLLLPFFFSGYLFSMERVAIESRKKEIYALVVSMKTMTDAESLVTKLSDAAYGNLWVIALISVLERKDQNRDGWVGIIEHFSEKFNDKLLLIPDAYNADLYKVSCLLDSCRFTWQKSSIVTRFYNNVRLESVRKSFRRNSLSNLKTTIQSLRIQILELQEQKADKGAIESLEKRVKELEQGLNSPAVKPSQQNGSSISSINIDNGQKSLECLVPVLSPDIEISTDSGSVKVAPSQKRIIYRVLELVNSAAQVGAVCSIVLVYVLAAK